MNTGDKRMNAMKTENTKPSVLIFGRNGSSNLCMARSFGKVGYEVEVLRIYQNKPKAVNLMQYLKPEARSTYVHRFHSCICDNQNSVIVEKLLTLAKPGEKMLLIPTCDMAASTADEYLETLREYYWIPNISGKAGEVTQAMRKDLQMTLAEKAGLPVINSCVIRTEAGQFTIPDTVRYPCFMKPNISKDSVKSTIGRYDSEAELREALTRFSRTKDIEMLVEDYVEIRQEYGLLGLSTREGAVCPGFFMKEQIGNEDRKGVTMVGRLIPTQTQQELIDGIARFVHSLRFEGLFDVDIIETVDGKWYFVELNLRYGASGYAVTESGVNLPAMYADYRIFGKPIDLGCRIPETGKQFVSEKVLLDEYARGFANMAEVREITNHADIHFILDQDDRKPYAHFRKFYLFGAVTRIWFRLKRRLKK